MPSLPQNDTVDMALTDPPAALNSQRLPLASVEGTLFRISHRKFSDPIYWSRRVTFLKEFDVCEIALGHRLKVVNLSGKRLNPLGIDANIFASPAYDITQRCAAAFMEHPDAPDGIRYPSRKNERLHNFALFSTPAAVAAVTISHRYPLLNHPHLFRLLQSYRVALI